MSDEKRNKPREVGYSKIHKDVYKEWIEKDSKSIFAGVKQADLFFFAMALGFHREKKKDPKNKVLDIPVNVFSKDQEWGILSTMIYKNKELGVLKDERSIYIEAEKYAEEGIEIIKSHIESMGVDYPKNLEVELRNLLK